jgi:phosphatidylglycerophosphate synthase
MRTAGGEIAGEATVVSPSDSGRPVPPATLYLASPEDAEAGRLDVAGLPVAFRALMSALNAGCPFVAVPAVYRGTEVDRAIGRSARARAHTVWLDEDIGESRLERMVLLPATVVLPPVALRALLEVPPVAVLSASPPEAPVVLADASLLAVAPQEVAASLPAGDIQRRALAAGREGVVHAGWCLRATNPETRKDAERRLYADLGSVIDTRLDRLVHRPLSRHLTRVAVALGLSPNLVSLANLALGLLAASYLAKATVGNTLIGIVIYFASAVLDHVDGEVARLTYAESRLGEWLDVTIDNVVHALMAVAMGMAAERVAGTGGALGLAMAIGFALSALAAKMSGNGEGVPRALTRLGNRNGFYVLLMLFLALLALAPAALPALLLVAAIGAHTYWVGHLALRLRHQSGRYALFDDTL